MLLLHINNACCLGFFLTVLLSYHVKNLIWNCECFVFEVNLFRRFINTCGLGAYVFEGNVKDLEGKIVEVVILRRAHDGDGCLNSGKDVAYIGRLESSDTHTIRLNPGVHVGQVRKDEYQVKYGAKNFVECLNAALAKSPIAIIGREQVGSIHQSLYTAEELSIKK